MNITSQQITTRELLEDKVFAAWLKREPDVSNLKTMSGNLWRVWIQPHRGGGWTHKDFKKYRKAYKFLIRTLEAPNIHDAILSAKIQPYKPPVVRVKATKKFRRHIPTVVGQHPAHNWCPYCRRPTIFSSFSKHHAFVDYPDYKINDERRCAVCGIRLSQITNSMKRHR